MWTAPRTWSDGELMTGALVNVHVRDNLADQGPAVVSGARQIAYGVGPNDLQATASAGALHLLRMNSAGDAPEPVGPDAYLPWLQQIKIFGPYASAVGTWTIANVVAGPFYGERQSTAQNDEIAWPVVLAAGTWTIDVLGRTHAAGGIASVRLDGVAVGTMDWYSASTLMAVKSVAGVVVAATGKKELKLVMATKHASSSGYALFASLVTLARTT